MEHKDVVVIGAGWAGLTVAKTYTQVHPDVDLVVLDPANSVGGTWAAHRLYPGLKTNSVLGSFENPDLPMTVEKFGVKPGQHIPGEVVHRYLTEFAKTFDIWRRIRFRTMVEEIQQASNGQWILTTSLSTDGKKAMETKKIAVNKLIMATGVTSYPFMPNIPGAETFDAPLFHARDFLQKKDLLKTAKKVVVYGGAKSALVTSSPQCCLDEEMLTLRVWWDAAYAYATSGVQVDWVIRESGGGPCWISPILVSPLKKCLELLGLTRILTLFNPTLWGDGDDYDFWRRLLHTTIICGWFVSVFWWALERDIVQLNGWDKDTQIKKLKPWFPAFWLGPSTSILNHPTDFYQHIRNGTVKVIYADITHLTRHAVHLSTGETLQVDALHCATGWKHEPPIKISPPSLAAKLGLPTHFDESRIELTQRADTEILKRFPRLRNQPQVVLKKRGLGTKSVESHKTPYRLYRHLAPPATAHARNFAVTGVVASIGTTTSVQMQALWITAYLDGTLDLPQSIDEIEYSTELSTRFSSWRYPVDHGDRHAAFVFDSLLYVDSLLRDLGLKFKRKGSWWKEMVEGYAPADYSGIVAEWIALRRTASEKK